LFLQGYVDRIANEKPLNARKLERYLLLMNDLAGVTARAVLSPSSTPGPSDVTIVISQKPYDLFAQVDNRGSRYLGQFQFNTTARVNNAFGFNEALLLQFATAPDSWPQREMDYGGVAWVQPVSREGTMV